MGWQGFLLAGATGALLFGVACSGDATPDAVEPDLAAADNRLVAEVPVRTPTATRESRPTATPTASATSVTPRPASRGIPLPTVEAGGIFIMDVETGASLYERNADARLAPASLTKIATAVVVLESGMDLNTVVEVQPDIDRLWLEDSSTMKLLPGDKFSLVQLLYGLLLVSGNDAAEELARAISGGEPEFVEAMNDLVQRLGMKNTYFTDTDGLGGPAHYTSARDMAILSKHAMTLPLFRQIVGTESHLTTGSQELFLYNYNPLLNYTPGVTGIKTGYTEQSGPTFVVSVEREGHQIIVVLLNAPGFPFGAIDLVEWAYADTIWP